MQNIRLALRRALVAIIVRPCAILLVVRLGLMVQVSDIELM
jgi:hypothetical protein